MTTKADADAEYERRYNPWVLIAKQTAEITRLKREIEQLKQQLEVSKPRKKR